MTIELNPFFAHVQSMLGFVHLQDMEQAVQLKIAAIIKSIHAYVNANAPIIEQELLTLLTTYLDTLLAKYGLPPVDTEVQAAVGVVTSYVSKM